MGLYNGFREGVAVREPLVAFFSSVCYCIAGIPVARILHRTGFSRWLALLIPVPPINKHDTVLGSVGKTRLTPSLLSKLKSQSARYAFLCVTVIIIGAAFRLSQYLLLCTNIPFLVDCCCFSCPSCF